MMTKLHELDAIEMEDMARCLDDQYTPEKFENDMAEFVQIKKSVLRHRHKMAVRQAKMRKSATRH